MRLRAFALLALLAGWALPAGAIQSWVKVGTTSVTKNLSRGAVIYDWIPTVDGNHLTPMLDVSACGCVTVELDPDLLTTGGTSTAFIRECMDNPSTAYANSAAAAAACGKILSDVDGVAGVDNVALNGDDGSTTSQRRFIWNVCGATWILGDITSSAVSTERPRLKAQCALPVQ